MLIVRPCSAAGDPFQVSNRTATWVFAVLEGLPPSTVLKEQLTVRDDDVSTSSTHIVNEAASSDRQQPVSVHASRCTSPDKSRITL